MIFTNIPRRGDICLGRLSDSKVLFARLDSITALSDIPASTYEINGVVADVRDGEALVVYKQNTTNKWQGRLFFTLTGYTLDGAEHSGVFSIRQASDSWAANHAYTFTYTASTLADLVSQLNAWFVSIEPFKTQDWYAEIYTDNSIRLNCIYNTTLQYDYNTGTDGFTLTKINTNNYIQFTPVGNMLRKNGFAGAAGTIGNMYKALVSFRSDTSAVANNPNTDVTTVKYGTPICLPAYLGTSQYQSDHCAFLRSVYGEGETGWRKFMSSLLPVCPSDWGEMGLKNGKERAAHLSSIRYNSNTIQNGATFPAADWCYQKSTSSIPQGNWYLPTDDEIYRILKDVRYTSDSTDRNIDVLNKALNLINGNYISNNDDFWTCINTGIIVAERLTGNGTFYTYASTWYLQKIIPCTTIKLT